MRLPNRLALESQGVRFMPTETPLRAGQPRFRFSKRKSLCVPVERDGCAAGNARLRCDAEIGTASHMLVFTPPAAGTLSTPTRQLPGSDAHCRLPAAGRLPGRWRQSAHPRLAALVQEHTLRLG